MALPLEGIKVIDFTGVQAGPTTSLSGSFKMCRGLDEPVPQ